MIGDVVPLALAEIAVGKRHRQDMGDLQPLADSMDRLGLLQPIGVRADFTLIFGERRLRAAQLLGWQTIPARVLDVVDIVEAEHDENELRLAFTREERVAIAKEYRRVMGERQGQRTDLGKPRDNCPEVEPGQRTRDILARKVGFSSGKQLERAEAVVDHGAPNVVEAMNAGDLSISAAPGGCSIPGRSWAANRAPSPLLPHAKFILGTSPAESGIACRNDPLGVADAAARIILCG